MGLCNSTRSKKSSSTVFIEDGQKNFFAIPLVVTISHGKSFDENTELIKTLIKKKFVNVEFHEILEDHHETHLVVTCDGKLVYSLGLKKSINQSKGRILNEIESIAKQKFEILY